jgi:7,8-dihydroneopterin aldolase/epimerase/oxygenase
MRSIHLDRLRVQANIGILEHELAAKQPLLISISVVLIDQTLIPIADLVDHVFDYRHLRNSALTEVEVGHINMLETLAGRIANRLLAFDAVKSARVRVDKPSIFTDCDSVALEVSASK